MIVIYDLWPTYRFLLPGQNVKPDLDPISFTLKWYSWKSFLKNLIMKKISRRQQSMKNFPGGKVLMESVTTLKHPNTSLTRCLLSNFACFFVVRRIFSKSSFSKNSFRNTIWVSNRLDPDQAWHSVGPNLCQICFQRLSADDISRQWVMHPNTSLTHCLQGNFACSFVFDWFFFKINFLNNSFRNTIWVSNILDPDQARNSVWPDLCQI